MNGARPGFTRFPYPTLFRSLEAEVGDLQERLETRRLRPRRRRCSSGRGACAACPAGSSSGSASSSGGVADLRDVRARSEEHTSELQSRRDLVCRLLLEKKKT